MADDGVQASEGSTGKWILLALAALYVAGSLYFIFDLRGRLDKVSKDQAASSTQLADLGKRMQSAEADDETLAHQVGLTKKEMAARSADLMRQQRASEARLAELVRAALVVPKRRKPTKPSRGAKEARLSEKKKRGDTKRQRRSDSFD